MAGRNHARRDTRGGTVIAAFTGRFLIAMAGTSCLLLGFAWATAATLFQPPPSRLFAHGFSFEVPKDWECARETFVARCEPLAEGDTYMRLGVYAELDRNGTRSLEDLRPQLTRPFSRTAEDGSAHQSTVIDVRNAIVDGREWLDAQYTYAEIGEDIRMMVTYNGPYMLFVNLASDAKARERAAAVLDGIVASMELDAGDAGL